MLLCFVVGLAWAAGAATFGIYASTLTDSAYPLLSGSLTWPGFGLHPLLMTLAFGALGTFASLSYRTFETCLGWSHGTAKAIHSALHLAALVVGTVGVCSMWTLVQDNGWSQLTSLHGRIGLSTLSLYWLQWLLAALIFSCGSPAVRKAFLPVHRYIGYALTVLCLGTFVTGTLSPATSADAGDGKDKLLAGAYMAVVQAVVIGAAFIMPLPSSSEESSLVATPVLDYQAVECQIEHQQSHI